MSAFERRLTRLATTLSFRDSLGEVAKNVPPPSSMVFGHDPIQCRVEWRIHGREGALRTNFAKSKM